MNGPYREPGMMVPADPRVAAEAALISAKASLIGELRRGLAIANQLAQDESSHSFAQRVAALESLYREVCGTG